MGSILNLRAGLLSVLFAVLAMPGPSFAANRCAMVFASQEKPEVSLLNWQGQKDLRKYRDELNSMDGLSYSYTNAKDELSYKTLNASIRTRLTTAEAKVLETYTTMSGSAHVLLNKHLSQKEKLKGEKAKQVNTFLTAFNKGVILPKGLLLFRGIGGDPFTVPAVGKKMRWDRATSTSMNPETARYFIDHESADRGLMLVIEVDTPVKALMSNDPREMEFLLAPEMEFEVVSKKRVRPENITIVHLKTTSAP